MVWTLPANSSVQLLNTRKYYNVKYFDYNELLNKYGEDDEDNDNEDDDDDDDAEKKDMNFFFKFFSILYNSIENLISDLNKLILKSPRVISLTSSTTLNKIHKLFIKNNRLVHIGILLIFIAFCGLILNYLNT